VLSAVPSLLLVDVVSATLVASLLVRVFDESAELPELVSPVVVVVAEPSPLGFGSSLKQAAASTDTATIRTRRGRAIGIPINIVDQGACTYTTSVP
jgi:hypothetical protein